MSLAAAAELLSPLFYTYFLTFCRIGAAFLLFPAFTDHVPQQARLLFALAVAMPISLIVGDGVQMGDGSEVFSSIMTNITLGIYLGLAPRLFLSSMQMAGQIIGQVSGLYNPFNINGLAFEGSTIISTLMVIAGTALIFAADLHITFIEALTSSFSTVGLNGSIDLEIMNRGIISIVSKSFMMAISFAAPFIVLGLVFNLALGVANKMMQALPVYFVFSPILMFLGIVLITITFATIATMFAENMRQVIEGL
jgi:flagellar biosynthetic protein FliR